MAFKKVVVVGGGVLGSQIAYQVAYKGFDVTVWLRSEGSIERAKPKFARWHETYLKDLEATKALIGTGTKLYPRGLVDDFENLTVEKVEELKAQADQAFESLIYELDMAKAMADADLVIESLSEDPKAKIAFYQQMAPLLPEKTVIVTNSSTMYRVHLLSTQEDRKNILHCILQMKSGKITRLRLWDMPVQKENITMRL